ncbi:TadE/TadG family type IV pilus assembly protein [Mycetocola reblochoni]|uniref:TadE/TadG family type IV pilus assembly protein n=1 Tax=Mycetocola reblochoni TaxID=331618 RepID=UPI003F94A574
MSAPRRRGLSASRRRAAVDRVVGSGRRHAVGGRTLTRGWPTPVDARRGDDGSALVEFLLVAALLLTVVGGIAQLLVVVHIRAVVSDAAADAARIAAYADGDDDEGRRRAATVIGHSLGREVAAQSSVRVHRDDRGVTVEIDAPVMAIGFTAPVGVFTVAGSALLERVEASASDPGGRSAENVASRGEGVGDGGGA